MSKGRVEKLSLVSNTDFDEEEDESPIQEQSQQQPSVFTNLRKKLFGLNAEEQKEENRRKNEERMRRLEEAKGRISKKKKEIEEQRRRENSLSYKVNEKWQDVKSVFVTTTSEKKEEKSFTDEVEEELQQKVKDTKRMFLCFPCRLFF